MTLTDIVHSLNLQNSYIKLKEVKISTGTATVFLINTTIALSDPKATFSSGSQKETFPNFHQIFTFYHIFKESIQIEVVSIRDRNHMFQVCCIKR